MGAKGTQMTPSGRHQAPVDFLSAPKTFLCRGLLSVVTLLTAAHAADTGKAIRRTK
jgi:hypothetical protein